MKSSPIKKRQVISILLVLSIILLTLVMKKVIIFTLILFLGSVQNFIQSRLRLPLNFTFNFFLSFFVIDNYGIFAFFAFILIAEIITRWCAGMPLPGAALVGYILWVITALISVNISMSFISVNISMSFIAIGIIMVIIRYIYSVFLHLMLSGSSFTPTLVRNLPQLAANFLAFIYLTPIFTVLV